MRQGLSGPRFCGGFVCGLRKIVCSQNFSVQFVGVISHFKLIGYSINVLQQTACKVVNPVTIGSFAFLFYCTMVGGASDSVVVLT